jgi:hypothetical protein
MKIHASVMIAKMLSNVKKHSKSIILLKKGLQYAWYIEEPEEEIKIYELLGIEYFNLGDI